ncbi:hypothetical protein [Novacetimonas pomaceti]|uniref:Uncharacterized protein n=1 Tax=Novacetimonas pomaceti TaxID=2021998 RepID=A0A318Q8P8_9PROT|nr:hypothetical protein [Novacetimonas pomaceti]PYD75120.1 hypothetical protein CFR71_10935 [Novacetimonas pomaceti]
MKSFTKNFHDFSGLSELPFQTASETASASGVDIGKKWMPACGGPEPLPFGMAMMAWDQPSCRISRRDGQET